MNKKMYKVIIVFFLLIVSISMSVNAKNTFIGSFDINDSEILEFNSTEYFSMEKLSHILEGDYSWKINNDLVTGYFNENYFESSDFLIIQNDIYLPVSSYEKNFNIRISLQDSKYNIYKISSLPAFSSSQDYKFELQTNKSKFERREAVAVSLLIINNNKNESSSNSNIWGPNNTDSCDLVLKRNNNEVWRLSNSINNKRQLNLGNIDNKDYSLYTFLIEPGKNKYLLKGEYELLAEISIDNNLKTENLTIYID